ncbi:MAG: hypothetical protein AAB455_01285 [Patescibacteria group bacterium]
MLQRDKKWEGGNVESHRKGKIQRSLIRRIKVTGRIARIFVNWVTVFDPTPQSRYRWRKLDWPNGKPLFQFQTEKFRLKQRSDGGLTIYSTSVKLPLIILFPRGSGLNVRPEEVSGLKPPQQKRRNHRRRN